jgi:hypothetical protein
MEGKKTISDRPRMGRVSGRDRVENRVEASPRSEGLRILMNSVSPELFISRQLSTRGAPDVL